VTARPARSDPQASQTINSGSPPIKKGVRYEHLIGVWGDAVAVREEGVSV